MGAESPGLWGLLCIVGSLLMVTGLCHVVADDTAEDEAVDQQADEAEPANDFGVLDVPRLSLAVRKVQMKDAAGKSIPGVAVDVIFVNLHQIRRTKDPHVNEAGLKRAALGTLEQLTPNTPPQIVGPRFGGPSVGMYSPYSVQTIDSFVVPFENLDRMVIGPYKYDIDGMGMVSQTRVIGHLPGTDQKVWFVTDVLFHAGADAYVEIYDDSGAAQGPKVEMFLDKDVLPKKTESIGKHRVVQIVTPRAGGKIGAKAVIAGKTVQFNVAPIAQVPGEQ